MAVRRSFVHDELVAAGAMFAPVADAEIARSFGDETGERAAVRSLALADLSPLPRWGAKGRDTMAWAAEAGLVLGEAPNVAYRQPSGLLIAKLAASEVVMLPDLSGPKDAPLPSGDGRLCFPVPRRESSLWFRLLGSRTPEMLAKLCGIDFRADRFADLAIAQTSIARMNGVLIRDDHGATPAFHLLADSASASFLWRSLLDAMDEYRGRIVGTAAL